VAKLSNDRLDKFRPQTRNANKHTQRGMGALEAAMRKYGYVAPMTAAADGEILDGSARIETSANVFGDDVIVVHHDGTKPVIMVRDDIPHGDTPQAREISIAANRIAQFNLDFDPEVILGDLQAGVDLEQFWRKDELDELLADLQPKATEGDTPAEIDRAEELRQKWGTAPGQLWSLDSGNGYAHRLICGDCTDAATVARVMGGERAAFCMTDPPYGVKYTGGTKKWTMLENDDEVNMYAASLPLIFEYTDPKAALYLCYASGKSLSVYSALRDSGFEQRAQIIWNKNQAQFGALGAQYKHKHEPVAYCFKVGQSPYWFGPNNEVTVWDIARANANEYHPTEKPPALYERALANSAPAGCIVYEPFDGSGTCIIACENLSRRCRAVEISPAYVAVALERFFQHSGKLPVLVSSE